MSRKKATDVSVCDLFEVHRREGYLNEATQQHYRVPDRASLLPPARKKNELLVQDYAAKWNNGESLLKGPSPQLLGKTLPTVAGQCSNRLSTKKTARVSDETLRRNTAGRTQNETQLARWSSLSSPSTLAVSALSAWSHPLKKSFT